MRIRLFLAAAALLSASLAAHADATVDFTYTATPPDFTGTASGMGSFTCTASPCSLADLTSFSFVLTLDETGLGTETFTFDDADLTSFSASLSGEDLTSLSLQTSLVVAGGSGEPYTFDEFIVNSLLSDGADTINSGSIESSIGTVTQTNISATPEPSSLVLLGTGLLGILGVARRRLA